MRIVAVLSVIFAFCSTAGSTGGADAGVALRVSPPSPELGDTITLILQNGSREPAGYNLCSSVLMMEVDGGWIEVPSDRVCTMELRTLQPGSEGTFRLDLPSDLEAAAYRFQTSIEWMQSGTVAQAVSDPFTVRR